MIYQHGVSITGNQIMAIAYNEDALKLIKRKIQKDGRGIFRKGIPDCKRKTYVEWITRTYTEDIEYCQRLINSGSPLVMFTHDHMIKLDHDKIKYLVGFLSRQKYKLINKLTQYNSTGI